MTDDGGPTTPAAPWDPPVLDPSTTPGQPINHERRGPRPWLAVATVVAAVGGGGVAGALTAHHFDGTGVQGTPVAVEQVSLASGRTGMLDVPAIIDALSDSVVSIETMVTVRRGPFSQDAEGAGTGVVISDDGLILTNAHVVADASSIEIGLDNSGVTRQATLVGIDGAAVIADLRVYDATGLRAATIGNSQSAAVVDSVVAIGNALALDGSLTVTSGIVSAVDPSIDTDS